MEQPGDGKSGDLPTVWWSGHASIKTHRTNCFAAAAQERADHVVSNGGTAPQGMSHDAARAYARYR